MGRSHLVSRAFYVRFSLLGLRYPPLFLYLLIMVNSSSCHLRDCLRLNGRGIFCYGAWRGCITYGLLIGIHPLHLLAGVKHGENSVQLKLRSLFSLIVFDRTFKGFLAAAFPCFHLSLTCWTFFSGSVTLQLSQT